MNALANQIYHAAVNDMIRQSAATQALERSPKVVYCLWQGDTLLGICGTEQRALEEKRMYESAVVLPKTPIAIEPRVCHS